MENKKDYEDKLTEVITDGKGIAKKVTKPMPPITLTANDLSWLSAYNAPHWMKYRLERAAH